MRRKSVPRAGMRPRLRTQPARHGQPRRGHRIKRFWRLRSAPARSSSFGCPGEEGGSGKASVASPAALRVENGVAYATIIWSSSNYDYMKVDGEKYDPLNAEGNATFEIPVSAFDWKCPSWRIPLP